MPDWVLPTVLQLPLVIGVAYYFDRREKKLHAEHQAELVRRVEAKDEQVAEWKRLHEQERRERVEAQRAMAATTAEVRGVLDALQDLTKEVVRNAPK